MDKFLVYTVTGVGTAAIYAIAACGLVVTYSTSGIFNFAHGAIGMMAAFTYWQLHVAWGWPSLPALIVVVFVIAPLFGAGVERVVIRGLEGASEVVRVVVPVSLMLFLLGLGNVIWRGDVGRNLSNFFPGDVVRIAGVNVSYHRLITLATAALVAVVLRLVLYRTRSGIAMRAVVDDRPLVQLNGGRPYRSSMMAWAIGASLAALAGVLIAPENPMSQLGLTLLVVNTYAVAVVGKLKSLPMTFLGALILGLTESYVAGYVTGTHQVAGLDLSALRYSISPILLFAVMVFQPQARLRSVGVQRVREGWRTPSMRTAVVGAAGFVVVVLGICTLLPHDTDLLPVIPGFFFALLAMSLVPLTGYAGQISLAQLTFAGIGGIMMSVVGVHSSPLGIVVAVAVTGIVGALIALPALRLSGIYLALATAAFSLFMSRFVFNQEKVMPGGNRQVPALDLGVIKIGSNLAQVMVLAVAFAVLGVGLIGLRHSAFGRRLTAMKDSPVACATLGLNLTRTKIGLFALSASIAGLAGALWTHNISSSDFDLTASMSITMLAVVGGVGAIGGAFFGGFLFGAINSVVISAFKDNAIGLFKFFELSISDLSQIAPGFIGVSLGRNPNGAISDIGDAYRSVGESPPALAVGSAVPVVLWILARTDVISNWTFAAAIAVFVLAMLPLLPLLFDAEAAPGGRPVPTAVVMVAALAGVCALDWTTLIASNGVKVVAIVATAIVIARIEMVVHGAVPPRVPDTTPSPDLLGIDGPITRSDVLDADVALGLKESDLRGVA